MQVSGSTATVAVIVGWDLLVASVGDSEAYLDTGAEVIQVLPLLASCYFPEVNSFPLFACHRRQKPFLYPHLPFPASLLMCCCLNHGSDIPMPIAYTTISSRPLAIHQSFELTLFL